MNFKAFLLSLILSACSTSPNTNKTLLASQSFQAGLGFFESQQYPESLNAFQTSWRLFPENIAYKMHYVLALDAVGQTREATKILEETCQPEKQYPECHNNLAVLYLKQSRNEAAYNAARQALSIPTYRSPEIASRNLGISLYRLSRYKEAVTAFDNALKSNNISHLCLSRSERSRSLLALAQFKESLHDARLARNICDNRPDIHFWLIYVLFKTGHIAEARSQLVDISNFARDASSREQAQRLLSQLNREEPLEEPAIIL